MVVSSVESCFNFYTGDPVGVFIGDKLVGPGSPCFIIAEIGINHNGDVEIAKRLIDVATKSGCDAVKFQKRTIELCYTPEELAKPREVRPGTGILQRAVRRDVLPPDSVERLLESDYEETTNGDLKYALEFNRAEYDEIDRYCKEQGIIWFASPWDEQAVDFLEKYNPPCYKIASPRCRDEELLRYVYSKGRAVILSTGACEEEHIRQAVHLLDVGELILMHCVLTYPVKDIKDLNLKMVKTLARWFPDVPVGYSGHEVGVPTTLMAVVLGAVAVERHITLDRAMFGSDQSASLEPGGLERLVRDIRMWEAAKGDGKKRILPDELVNFEKLRRKVLT